MVALAKNISKGIRGYKFIVLEVPPFVVCLWDVQEHR